MKAAAVAGRLADSPYTRGCEQQDVTAVAQSFWADSGFQDCVRNEHGWLVPQPDYWRRLLQRPELAPMEESSGAERDLHRRLIDKPLLALAERDLLQLDDADTRDNYLLFLAFRDAVIAQGTLERYYLSLFQSGKINVPPVLIDAVAAPITRNVLEPCDDAFLARAGELFFRPQRVSVDGGQVLAADQATIELYEDTGGFGSLGRLLKQQNVSTAQVKMDILNRENEPFYWLRDALYCFVLDMTGGRDGLQALAALIERWVAHFHAVEVHVEPVSEVKDDTWRWHTGLDRESTGILNTLYEGKTLSPDQQERLIGLFTLTFADSRVMRTDVAGKSVYLGLAFDAEHLLKMKPQNLLVNLPLVTRS